MQGKLQELTEKIYQEGVQKAQKEVEILLQAATQKAQNIEQEAQKKAKAIIAEAEKKAELLDKHVQSELKMSVAQSTSALKQDLTNLPNLLLLGKFARLGFLEPSLPDTVPHSI